MFGLSDSALASIYSVFMKLPETEKVIIFGSRAMGNYKKGSDIDIAVIGKNINADTIITLNVLLNERLSLPYYFDVLDYNKIENLELKKHIDKEGKLLYEKK